MVNLGDIVPDFNCDSTHGSLNFHKYIEGSWAILFSHPSDFTPVCTTELGRVGSLAEEFARRGVKLIALSCDSADSHRAWVGDIAATQGHGFPYPIIADESREIATLWGMLQKGFTNQQGIPLTCRALYIIGPDKKLKLSVLYPASTGRNFPEILRCVDSLQLTAQFPVATPADWQVQGDCMVIPTLSDAEATQKFPKGFRSIATPSGRKYLRMTPNPKL